MAKILHRLYRSVFDIFMYFAIGYRIDFYPSIQRVLYIPASAGLDHHQQFDQKGASRLEWEAGV